MKNKSTSISSLMNTSVSDAKCTLELHLKNDPAEARTLANQLLNKLSSREGHISRVRMAQAIIRKADRVISAK
ncbi:hypothetical protein K5N55_003866 [Vibrio vulnificus]|nr:hypothetical protein [Vibrio vulnificus]MCU8194287.1 hypothetical protein [Vibrio vulnificus]HAS6231045.1 hypothetical protein [Vibrio vulnificus]HDY7776801.1 hypothetical protein [Vibrio vulnificus]